MDGGRNKNPRETHWKTLKLPDDVFDAFGEVKETLKKKHNKPVSNADTMKFLLYLAKVALELNGNPKLEGIVEPLIFDKLSELENYCRSVSDYLGIPIEYVRGGVLLGLLEIALFEIVSKSSKTSWRKSEYYLELAEGWAGDYSVYVYEAEVSNAIASIISEISLVGQGNPHRKEIQGSLFEEVKNLMSLLFPTPPIRTLRALVMGEAHSNQRERALGILRRALRHENPQNTNEIREMVSGFLKKAYVAVDGEKFKKFVEGLLNGSHSLPLELFIIETASDFVDVRPFYEDVLNRNYLLPEDRIEVAKSMVRTASKRGDDALLSRAIEVAKVEFKKLRGASTSHWKSIRESFAMTLMGLGFGDRISELMFPDEVPSLWYYLLTSLSKLREDFENGWEEFKRLLSRVYAVTIECGFPSSTELFLPVENGEWIEECMKAHENESINFQELSVFIGGTCCEEIKAEQLVIYAENTPILSLGIGELYGLSRETVALLLRAMIESGVPIGDDFNKILAADLLKGYDKSLAKALLEEVIAGGTLPRRLGDIGFFKLLDDVGIDPLEALRMVLRKTPPEIQEGLLDSFIKAVAISYGYSLASKLVMDYNIPTSFLPWLIKGLLREGNLERADDLASKFGLGWFGIEDLEALLEYRLEKCISPIKEQKYGKKDAKGVENTSIDECFKKVMSLLKHSSKKLRENDEYFYIGGRLAGRLIVWKIVSQR